MPVRSLTHSASPLHRWSHAGPLAARILAAVFGGYALAALGSLAALALPTDRPQAVLGGMQASFALYAAAVIWVFLARSATRAWAGLLLSALPLGLLAWLGLHGTTGGLPS